MLITNHAAIVLGSGYSAGVRTLVADAVVIRSMGSRTTDAATKGYVDGCTNALHALTNAAATSAQLAEATNSIIDYVNGGGAWTYINPTFPWEYQSGTHIANEGNGELIGYKILNNVPAYNATYFFGANEGTRTQLTVQLGYSFPNGSNQILVSAYGGYGIYYWNGVTKTALSTPGFLGITSWTNSPFNPTNILLHTTVNVPANKMVSMWYKTVMATGGTGYFNFIRYRYR
jgi:hypothetical protein